jgi:hypothetical protein
MKPAIGKLTIMLLTVLVGNAAGKGGEHAASAEQSAAAAAPHAVSVTPTGGAKSAPAAASAQATATCMISDAVTGECLLRRTTRGEAADATIGQPAVYMLGPGGDFVAGKQAWESLAGTGASDTARVIRPFYVPSAPEPPDDESYSGGKQSSSPQTVIDRTSTTNVYINTYDIRYGSDSYIPWVGPTVIRIKDHNHMRKRDSLRKLHRNIPVHTRGDKDRPVPGNRDGNRARHIGIDNPHRGSGKTTIGGSSGSRGTTSVTGWSYPYIKGGRMSGTGAFLPPVR